MSNLADLYDAIVKAYHLDKRIAAPSKVEGGLLHDCWRLPTARGEFIVKILNPSVMRKNGALENYRISEIIATQFSEFLPAVTALTVNQKPVFIYDDYAVMVFPFVDGQMLTQNAITDFHVKKISEILAVMHNLNLSIENSASDKVVLANKTTWHEKAKNLQEKSQECASLLQQTLPLIEKILENFQNFETLLSQDIIISHRDLDPKNVLWSAEDCHIIDWESAGKINRSKDLIATAIYWSLDKNYLINESLFKLFIDNYTKTANSKLDHQEITAGFYGLLSDWLAWLEFNITREETNLGRSETQKTLTALPILYSQKDNLLRYLTRSS